MRSTAEPIEGNKVKLSVTVDETEFEAALDRSWKAIAKEVRVPGFRHGKVPRKVLEARIEKSYARSEAIKDAIPEAYVAAVREHDVDVIAQPEIDITAGEDDGEITFDAVVEVRPQIEIHGYQGLTLTIPGPNPTDGDVTEQLDRLRNGYAEFADVERPVQEGDTVTIDIRGSQDDEEVPGLTAEDYSYEVGTGSIVPELDAELIDLEVGDTAEFDADHPQTDEPRISFEVVVKAVKEKVLPELTDEWVAEATEFATVDELRDDTVERLSKVRRAQASMAVQSKLGDSLADLVTDELPESLIGAEMRARLENLMQRLQQQGISLEQYFQVTGTEPEQFTGELRTDSENAIKVDLAFRAIVVAEGLEASDDELVEEIERIASGAGIDAEAARAQLEQADQLAPIRSEVSRRKAMTWLIERAEIVDETGHAVRREDLVLPGDETDETDEHDEHDHDHDHDHDHEH